MHGAMTKYANNWRRRVVWRVVEEIVVRARSVLPHLDFVSPPFEADRVHELADQVNPAPVVGIQVLTARRVGDKLRLETWSRISHRNYDPAVWIRLQPAPDLLGCVIRASVNHRIHQSFLNRQPYLQSFLLWNIQLNQGFLYGVRDATDCLCIRGETKVEQFGQFALWAV